MHGSVRGTARPSRDLGLERRLARAIEGRGSFRRLHARPVRDGRVDLPDHAARRGVPEERRRRRGRSRHRAGARRSRHRARRRHVPERTADRTRADRRLQPPLQRHQTGSTLHENGRRRARPRPGAPQRPLAAEGLFFPVEPSTASRCTIGGMIGNNSCGARSLRYGKMVDNVIGVRGAPARRRSVLVRPVVARPGRGPLGARRSPGEPRARARAARRSEIERMFPKVQRRVGGYNLDSLLADEPNLAHLLVGSEGTLGDHHRGDAETLASADARRDGRLPLPVLPVRDDDDAASRGAGADGASNSSTRTCSCSAPTSRCSAHPRRHHQGRAGLLLLVEFAGDDLHALRHDLKNLDQCMADHGFPSAVVEVVEPARQRQVWEVREACLNIMMSMKGDGKPVSFIEDCAVPLEHLADYTDAVTELFSPGTAPAAPGMRMPRSAVCTCARSSTSRTRATSAPCAPSPRPPAISSNGSRARIRASMATASRAPSSTSACSGAASCAPSRR